MAAGTVAKAMGARAAAPLVMVFVMFLNIFINPDMIAKYEPAQFQPNVNCFDEWYNQYQALFGLNNSNLNEGAPSAYDQNSIINRLKEVYGYQTGFEYDSVATWENDTDGITAASILAILMTAQVRPAKT